MKLVWLTDPHFLSAGTQHRHNPRERLTAAIAYINQHHSDAAFCVISGDIADVPTPENYADVAARLQALKMPYLPLTGNHDARAPFAAHLTLPYGTMDGFIQYAHTQGGLRVLCLDTLTPGDDAGSLCDARLSWLEGQFAQDNSTPTLVFLHHPPIELGHPTLDPSRLVQGEALLARLTAQPCVKHLFFGHVHMNADGVAQGLPYAALKAVTFQAMPPSPAWDWDSFEPPDEAPEVGVITVSNGQVSLQREAFCDATVGVDSA